MCGYCQKNPNAPRTQRLDEKQEKTLYCDRILLCEVCYTPNRIKTLFYWLIQLANPSTIKRLFYLYKGLMAATKFIQA